MTAARVVVCESEPGAQSESPLWLYANLQFHFLGGPIEDLWNLLNLCNAVLVKESVSFDSCMDKVGNIGQILRVFLKFELSSLRDIGYLNEAQQVAVGTVSNGNCGGHLVALS